MPWAIFTSSVILFYHSMRAPLTFRYLFTVLTLSVSVSMYAQNTLEDLIKSQYIGTPEEQYVKAINISLYYRDTLYALSDEYKYLKIAERIARSEGMEQAIANSQMNLGINCLNRSQYDSSYHYLNSAKSSYYELQDSLKALEINEYIANVQQQQNLLPEALKTYHDLILKYEQMKTFEGDYYACINRCNAAYILYLQKNYQQANAYLSPCYDAQKRYRAESDEASAMNELSVNFDLRQAQSYEAMNQPDSAAKYFYSTLTTSQAINYPYTEAYALLGLGNYALNTSNEPETADRYFKSAIEIFKNIEYDEGVIPALNGLSQTKLTQRNYEEAKTYALQTVDVANKIGQFEGLKDGYLTLSEVSAATADHKTAIEYYRQHVAYKDSILNLDRAKILQENQSRFEAEKKDIEINNLAEQNRLTKRTNLFQLISFIVGTIALLAIGYFIYTKQKLSQVRKAAQYEKQISHALNKFVPQKFLKALGREHILQVELGDQIEQEVTILFTDIRSFTTISESMNPIENFQFVKKYAERMGPIIVKYNGFINQYLGDGIMAIFPSGASDALQACIEMQQAVRDYEPIRTEKGETHRIRVGMGLHTGPLVMGIIGDETRQDAAIISDTVNTAARLESLTKEYGVGIILSQRTLENIANPEAFSFRYLGSKKVKGKAEGIQIYECLEGDDAETINLKKEYLDDFTQGVTLFENEEYEKALKILSDLWKPETKDKVIGHFIQKIEQHEIAD